jgi:hypothetical protein
MLRVTGYGLRILRTTLGGPAVFYNKFFFGSALLLSLPPSHLLISLRALWALQAIQAIQALQG